MRKGAWSPFLAMDKKKQEEEEAMRRRMEQRFKQRERGTDADPVVSPPARYIYPLLPVFWR